MEELHRARYVGRGWSFHALSGCVTLLAPLLVHQSGSCLNPVLLGVLMEAS